MVCEDCGIEEANVPAVARLAVTWRKFPDHKSETKVVKKGTVGVRYGAALKSIFVITVAEWIGTGSFRVSIYKQLKCLIQCFVVQAKAFAKKPKKLLSSKCESLGVMDLNKAPN